MPIDPNIAQGFNPGEGLARTYALAEELQQRRQQNELYATERQLRTQQAQQRQTQEQETLAQEQEAEQAKSEAMTYLPFAKQGNPEAIKLLVERASKKHPQIADMYRVDPEGTGRRIVEGLEAQLGLTSKPGGALYKMADGTYGSAETAQGAPFYEPPRQGPAPRQPPAPPSGYRFTDDGALAPIPGGPASGNKPDRSAQSTEIQLASQFSNQSKDMSTVSGQYRRILAVSKKPSPANDFALIYAFAKIQDPTSVVRESEFAQAAKTGAYGDQVQAAIGKVANGKTLTARQRADFLDAARNAYAAQEQQWNASVVEPMRQQAEAYGLDFKNVFKDYRVKESASEPQKSFTHSSGATVEILD